MDGEYDQSLWFITVVIETTLIYLLTDHATMT